LEGAAARSLEDGLYGPILDYDEGCSDEETMFYSIDIAQTYESLHQQHIDSDNRVWGFSIHGMNQWEDDPASHAADLEDDTHRQMLEDFGHEDWDSAA
jgi:hypothetical protein